MKKEQVKELLNELDGKIGKEEFTLKIGKGKFQVVINKTSDQMNISVKKSEPTEKEQFEDWLNTVDDDIFEDSLENFCNKANLTRKQFNDYYNSNENVSQFIKDFKQAVKNSAMAKIMDLKNRYLLGD